MGEPVKEPAKGKRKVRVCDLCGTPQLVSRNFPKYGSTCKSCLRWARVAEQQEAQLAPTPPPQR